MRTFATLLLTILSVSTARAHNPDNSWAIVRVTGDTLEVEVEMATEAAMALLGVPMGTQPAPDDRNELIAPLTKAARAGEVYRFSSGETELQIQQATVEMLEEDGVKFRLTFALPPNASGSLSCEAKYLALVTEVHRAAITLVDANGGVIAGRFLSPEKRTESLPLPREAK